MDQKVARLGNDSADRMQKKKERSVVEEVKMIDL